MIPTSPSTAICGRRTTAPGRRLAIPRALFERLGGFDEHFAPAYYEDADLAMRVRAAGYRVYYQPAARVVHFEGVSAGTDRGSVVSGMKRYQAINREKFLDRWGAEIADWGVRGEDLEQTKERWVRRRRLGGGQLPGRPRTRSPGPCAWSTCSRSSRGSATR